MQWKLVEDVWSVIFQELNWDNLQSLAQVHSWFWRLLRKNRQYRLLWLRYSSIPDERMKKACEWGYWEPAVTLLPQCSQEQMARSFVHTYPASYNYLWPEIPSHHRSHIVYLFWMRKQFEIANQLASESLISSVYLCLDNAFTTRCQQHYPLIQPWISNWADSLADAIFLSFVRLGEIDKLKEIYSSRVTLSQKTMESALGLAKFHRHSDILKWLARLYHRR